MSTKGTHIPDWLAVPVCRHHACAHPGERSGPVPDRQLAGDPARVSRQDAALQQRVRNQREDSGLSRPREARQVSRCLCAHQGRHAVSVGDRPRVLSPVRAGMQPRQNTTRRFPSRRRAVSRRSRTGPGARRGDGRAAQWKEGGGRRIGSGRTQRRISVGPSRLRSHDLRKVAEGRRSEQRRHSDWVLPQDVLDREIERLVELGITIKTNTEVGKDVSWDDLKNNTTPASWRWASPSRIACVPKAKTRLACSMGCRSCATSGWELPRSSSVRAWPSSVAAIPRSTVPAKRCARAPRK